MLADFFCISIILCFRAIPPHRVYQLDDTVCVHGESVHGGYECIVTVYKSIKSCILFIDIISLQAVYVSAVGDSVFQHDHLGIL